MGILDKAKFWKHDDFTLDVDKPTTTPQDFTYQNPPLPGQPTDQQQLNDPLNNYNPPNNNYPQETFNHDVFNQQTYPPTTPFPGTNRVPEQQYVEQVHTIPSRDVELILAKLDSIKSELDALHQRVRKLESIADKQTETQRKYW